MDSTEDQDQAQNQTPSFDDLQSQAQQTILQTKAARKSGGSTLRLWLLIKNYGLRNWVYSVGVLLALVALGSMYKSAQELPEQEVQAPLTFDEKDFFLTTNPMQLTRSVKEASQTAEYKQALGEAIVNYDSRVLDSLEKNLEAMIASESVRLRDSAMKEAQSGVIANSDSAERAFNMSQCPQQTLESWKCVLLRFAVEGMDAIAKGNQLGDIAMVAKGYVRYRAAMIAVGGGAATKEYNFTWSVKGMEETIRAAREINTIAPGASLPTVTAPIPGAKETTNRAIGQNPVNTSGQ